MPREISTSRRKLLATAVVVLGSTLPLAAQWDPDNPDPGFPENGFSYPAHYRGPRATIGEYGFFSLDCTGWPPPSWLPHRGNRLYLARSEKKGLPLQMFRVRDEEGRPLAGVTVEFQQAGYRRPGIRGETDADGAFYVTVKKPERSHRVRFSAPDRREVVMELSGGPLTTARHEIELGSGSPFEPSLVLAWTPEERTPPPPDVLRAYRRGLRALEREQYEVAARQLRTAVERWPLAASAGRAEGGSAYRPYRALAEALEELGETELAAGWKQRSEQLATAGS